MKHIKRPVVAIDTSNQMSLLASEAVLESSPPASAPSRIRFEDPDPRLIRINELPLEEHLKQMGQKTPLRTRALLERVSFAGFEASYHASGRPPYAPRAMVGLILYGIMHGVSSLRDLERLARLDMGCWWISGGIAPDHSIIGRFVQRHAELLTQEFFKELTQQVLKATGSNTQVLAGDGTVIEAAASRYRLMRAEALAQALADAREQAQAEPSETKQRQVQQLEQAQAVVEQRISERRAHGKDVRMLLIQPLEPDAVVQPQKDKQRFRASYKPQVLANEARVIVACDVHPSSETAKLPELLDRASAQGKIKAALLDAGYFSDAVLQCMQARDIELLCPEGRNEGEDWNKQSNKLYPKSRFVYEAEQDCYMCPNGQRLSPIRHYQGNLQVKGYVIYATTACTECPLKAHCTRSDEGRKIKRYAGDQAKDALRLKMSQPEARTRYLQRQAMVEPVFSHLRTRQGLNRFRRWGLSAVRVEFALHAMAHNLSRAVVLLAILGLYRCRRLSRAIATTILGSLVSSPLPISSRAN